MNEKGNVIRVLHVVDNLSITAGVSNMLMNLYRSIDKKKIQFDFLVAAHSEKSYEREIVCLGGCVFYFGNPLSFRTFLSANRKANDFFRQNAGKYNVVHLHSPTICEFTVKYAKKYGVRHIIIHSHSSMTSVNPIKAFINSILQRRVKQLATEYWACSTEAGEYLFGKENKHKTTIIFNAVNTDSYAFDEKKRKKIRSSLGLDGCVAIFHVAYFTPIKNHVFLIPIIKKLYKSSSNIKFVFVGVGSEKEHFENELKKQQLLNQCLFLGRRNDVNNLLQAADLLILPSIKEGLPVTVVEGQASGLPCMISDSITHDVQVNNVTYVPLDSNKWVEYIESFIPFDDKTRREKSLAFRKSKFNILHEAERVLGLYSKMLQEDD